MNTREHVTEAHFNDIQWKKELSFFADEIQVWKRRLGEVSAKNTHQQIKMTVSHFENQFIIYKDLIDELKHEIQVREDLLAKELKNNPIAYEHRSTNLYMELKGKMDMFLKLYTELKQSFQKFLAETM